MTMLHLTMRKVIQHIGQVYKDKINGQTGGQTDRFVEYAMNGTTGLVRFEIIP
jgi:hypothetical protein